MPIYDGVTKTEITPITEQELLTEGLFGDDPPKEFIEYAKAFYKKISRKLDIKPMGLDKLPPLEYIKDNPKWKYQFNIDDPNYNPAVAYALAGAKGGAAGAAGVFIPGVNYAVIAANSIENERRAIPVREKLRNIIRASTGMKVHEKSQMLYFLPNRKKDYIYISWPAVAMEGEYYTVYAVMLSCVKYKKWAKNLELKESAITSEIPGIDDVIRDEDGKIELSSLFAGFDTQELAKDIVDNKELNSYVPYPNLKATFNEYFDITDDSTRKQLMSMNEAQHNSTLTNLTSKLYDQIVSKAHNIDFGEIPKTKGDITKLSNYETLLDTLGILKGIVKEYKEDTKPIDEISIAIANIQARKDMFMRAFRSNSELPMLMYDNMVMAVVVGTSHMISACIEFIKAPRNESFIIQLDKIAYNRSKDHMIYSSISKFNHICDNGDFDKAMNSVLDQRIRKFTGTTVAMGVAIGIVIITFIIPILRELVYLFYHARVNISDYFEVQADLLTMNAYNLENNDISTKVDKSDIVDKQRGIADKFRKIANFFAIKNKKAEVEASKDIANSNKKYKLDSDANIVTDEPDETTTSSALF